MEAPSALKPQPIPIPLDLRKDLVDSKTPWQISQGVFERMQQQQGDLKYRKVQLLPTDPDWRFVWRYFHYDKPKTYCIKQIFCVHERHQTKAFEFNLSAIEREAEKFPPTWQTEPRAEQRAQAISRWEQATKQFEGFSTFEEDNRRRTWNHVKLLPLWHGSDGNICHSISEAGFAFFGKKSIGSKQSDDPKSSTDDGYFGSGIYFTNSSRYAADIYSKGHLLMAWVAMRVPFPVVGDLAQQDMETLKGTGAYKKYDAHYVPVVPKQNTSTCAVYVPCKSGEEPYCDEVVVFQRANALPRYWVELEVEAPYLMQPTKKPKFVTQLLPVIINILQNPEVDEDLKLRNILNKELALLMQLPGDEDLCCKCQRHSGNCW